MLTVGIFLTPIPAIPDLYSEFGFIPGLPARVEETMLYTSVFSIVSYSAWVPLLLACVPLLSRGGWK